MAIEETGPVMTLGDIRAELASGRRVLLLVRHAERPHIDHEDPTFGAALPLTENGCRMCRAFGAALRGVTDDIQFRASPMRRTVMSARCIAEGLGVACDGLVEDEAIGNGSPFIEDAARVWELFRDGRFFVHMSEYCRTGILPGFAPNDRATAEYERYVLGLFTGRLGIFTTHDVFVAAYLLGKGVKRDWSPDNWPRFLDAAALVVGPEGGVRAGLLRAGLSDRATGV